MWSVEFTGRARRELGKLGPEHARRILRFLRESIQDAPDPRRYGKPLKGARQEFWRYRVGRYRIVCALHDNTLLVLVVRVAHRREAYR